MANPRLLLRALVFGCSSLAVVAWSQSTGLRTWTDTSGKHRVEAELVRMQDGKVTLRRADGSALEVPLEKLSESDRAFVHRQTSPAGQPPEKSTGKSQTKSTATVNAKSSGSERKPDQPATAAIGEWPQWRGPNRDGISAETGLLDRWPAEGPPLLWKANGLGSGYSSVAVSKGKLFTLGRVGGQVKLIALSADEGQPLWTAEAGGGGDPNGTPTVAEDLVLSVSLDGDLVCVNAETGAPVWRKNFAQDFGGKMMSGWGYSESVLVDGDRVICTPGSQHAMLAALDKQTGRTIWTTTMPDNVGRKGQDGAGYSSAVVSHAAGVKQYVQVVGRGVIGVDAQTGELLWGYNDVANGTANIPTPLVKGDFVFCSTGYGDGGSALLKLSGGRGRITPQVVYSLPANKTQNHHGGMLLIGDYIYMGHGHNNGFPLCMEFLTGRDVWRPGRGPGSGSAAVAFADGHLYFRYENGVMALIEATSAEYRLKGEFRIAIQNGKSWPHPVIAGGRLYLRDQSELVCYDLRWH